MNCRFVFKAYRDHYQILSERLQGAFGTNIGPVRK